MDVRRQLKQIQEQVESARKIGACLDKDVYYVNGSPCSWDLVLDGEKVYQGIETGIGLTQYKDFVIACHKIYTEKMNHVKTLENKINHNEKARSKSMSKNNFRSVFEDLKDVYKIARLDSVSIYEKINTNEKKFSERPIGMSDMDFTLLKAEYLTKKKELNNEIEDAKNHLHSEVEKLEERLQELSGKYYRIRPDKMDENTIKLIEMGALSLDDFENLTNDFKNNVTMLKIISKAVSDKINAGDGFGKKGGHALQEKLKAMTSPAYYSDGFNTIKQFGERLFSKETWERETFDKVFDGIIDGAIENASDVEIE